MNENDKIKSFVDFMATPGFDLLQGWLKELEHTSLSILRSRASTNEETQFNRGVLETLDTLRNNIENIYKGENDV